MFRKTLVAGRAFVGEDVLISNRDVPVLAEVELQQAKVVDVYDAILVEVGRGVVGAEVALDE